MTGVDNYSYLINETLGIQSDNSFEIDASLKSRCSVLKFFDINKEDNGKKVSKVIGEDFLKNNPKVLLYDFNFEIGDRLFTANDDSKRVGFYIAYGDTREELDELMNNIETNIKFVFD